MTKNNDSRNARRNTRHSATRKTRKGALPPRFAPTEEGLPDEVGV
jgi:hypothetical protein